MMILTPNCLFMWEDILSFCQLLSIISTFTAIRGYCTLYDELPCDSISCSDH